MRKISSGLTFRDWRVINANLSGIDQTSPRKRFTPSKMLPKPQRDMPVVYGVAPSYLRIAGLRWWRAAGSMQDENLTTPRPSACWGTGRGRPVGNLERWGNTLK